MERFDEKKVSETLRQADPTSHYDQVVAKAAKVGPLPWEKQRRSRFVHILVPALTAALVLGIAVPVTWALTRNATHQEDLSSQKGGAADMRDAQKFLSETASHYYPDAIGNLVISGTVYADFYYAFNSEYENFVVVGLHRAFASSFNITAASDPVGGSSAGFSAYGTSLSSFSWDFTFDLVSGSSVTGSYSFELTPFYLSVINS